MKIDGYFQTSRVFIDNEDRERFWLYVHLETEDYRLISHGSKNHAKGTEVNGFYICAHCGVSIKINNSKIIHLKMGEFYNILENEIITHKKYTGVKRFTKCTKNKL